MPSIHARPRLSAAGAFLAASALLAGMNGAGAQVDTALAAPRVGRAALPHPLLPSDVALYRRIFQLQARGQLSAAAEEVERLADGLLVGHVLADRYLSRFHRATPQELRDHLLIYGDHPDAVPIHALLARRLPRAADAGPAPVLLRVAGGEDPVPLVLARASRAGRPGDADVPDHTSGTRADAVMQLFLQNRDAEALAAALALPPSASITSLFAGGLAAWRLQRWEDARRLFEAASRTEPAAPGQGAAAAFWAARANLATRNPQGYAPWLERAAADPRAMHGLLARRLLGQTPRHDWHRERLSPADAALVMEQPAGRRALALLQVGQTARAEAELRALWPTLAGRPVAQRATLLTAAAAGFTGLAAQFANLLHAADGRAAQLQFPVPRLMPRDGFRVDPSLIYALARVESNFDPTVVSPAGARGLMQLMPVTAAYIASDPSLANANRDRLHDPELNLELGQRYIWYLANQRAIGSDLIRLLASYNSGPGGVMRWGPQIRHNDDPLLFIEAIPVTETRRFVAKALAHSWLYAARLGLPSTSLDELAAGQWPQFRQPMVVLARPS